VLVPGGAPGDKGATALQFRFSLPAGYDGLSAHDGDSMLGASQSRGGTGGTTWRRAGNTDEGAGDPEVEELMRCADYVSSVKEQGGDREVEGEPTDKPNPSWRAVAEGQRRQWLVVVDGEEGRRRVLAALGSALGCATAITGGGAVISQVAGVPWCGLVLCFFWCPTLNPKPKSLNPKPETRNPKPEALNHTPDTPGTIYTPQTIYTPGTIYTQGAMVWSDAVFLVVLLSC